VKPIETPSTGHNLVSSEEWLKARKAFLAKEKEFTRQRDELSRLRRELPWERVDKNYVFETADGKQSLADLFKGRSQLIVYHFMLGPGWEAGCPSCSFLGDHFDGQIVHLNARDVTFLVVSRAPLAEIEAFKRRMGWHFNWVSSFGSDFNYDYQASFDPDDLAKGEVYYNYNKQGFGATEGPGASVFHKDKTGSVFHTYSTYGRGLDIFLGVYNFLDLTPKGRDEEGLQFSMSWVRHHDRYNDNYKVDPAASYKAPEVLPALPVRIEHVAARRVASVRHIGPYAECGEAWGKLIPALASEGVLGADSIKIGIGHDNPAVIPLSDLRYDACVSVDVDYKAPDGIFEQIIPGGEYAIATLTGPYDRLAGAYRFLLEDWLPRSGRKKADHPPYEVYVSDATKTAPESLVTEIYVPLRSAEPEAGCCGEHK
jgi:predicted dithiol-disulfide oxidoreductase (DUF899 family)/DNA gyrase inhibitor GyrI